MKNSKNMTDKIQKALAKFGANDRKRYKQILIQLQTGNWEGLDVQPLKGKKNEWRIRFGRYRIIIASADDEVYVLDLGPRDDNTYKSK